MAKALTEKQVRNLKPQATRYEVWEGNGLGIRVSPSGRKSWVLMYRYESRQRRLTLGRYPVMSVAEAHKDLAQAMMQLERNDDPGEEVDESKRLKRDSPTVADLAEIYIESWAKPRKRSWAEDQRILNKDVLPSWKNRKAHSIRRRDVIALLDRIVDRGSPIIANRTFEIVRRMFNFAIERDILDVTPCSRVRPPGKERRRDRVLSNDEIRAFWRGLQSADMSEKIRLALKLLLATAQRRGEVASARWQDIDRKSGWWTIPQETSKNGLSHRVPISKIAEDLLDKISNLSGDTEFLFPSPTRDSHITAGSLSRALFRNRVHFSLERFTTHDLRRTAASKMASIGVSRVVLGKILNHADRSVTAVYDRHSYDSEKRDALRLWSQELDRTVSRQPKPSAQSQSTGIVHVVSPSSINRSV